MTKLGVRGVVYVEKHSDKNTLVCIKQVADTGAIYEE